MYTSLLTGGGDGLWLAPWKVILTSSSACGAAEGLQRAVITDLSVCRCSESGLYPTPRRAALFFLETLLTRADNL